MNKPQACTPSTFLVFYNGNKRQIRNVQVAYNFITIPSIILNFCLGNPNCNWASMP